LSILVAGGLVGVVVVVVVNMFFYGRGKNCNEHTILLIITRAQFEDFLKTKKRKKKETAAGDTNSLTHSPVFFSNHTHIHTYNNNKHQN
jgi:hypothetical protein